MLGGLALYGLGAIVWLSVLSRIAVSVAYPFVSIGFLFTAALAVFILGEPLTRPVAIGTLLIMAGMVLFARMSALTQTRDVVVAMLVAGFGMGLLMPVYTVAIQNAASVAALLITTEAMVAEVKKNAGAGGMPPGAGGMGGMDF